MPIDPIKIPQNVYIEDRIVGPLTLKQIIIVAAGCGFSYALYSMLLKSYGQISLPVTAMCWIPGALSFLFAFLRINDLSLLKICMLSLERINKPPVRTWSPRRGIVVNIRTFTSAEEEKNKKKAELLVEKKNPEQIGELSSILDLSMPGSHKDEETSSPLEEIVEDTEVQDMPATLPVNPARVSVSPMNPENTTDTVMHPKAGSVSIFRDIAPRS